MAKNLKEQETIYVDVKESARLEYERWEIKVRKWLKKNQINPSFDLNDFEKNGHLKQKQSSPKINLIEK